MMDPTIIVAGLCISERTQILSGRSEHGAKSAATA